MRSEEHTSELQSRQDLPSSPTRRSSDLLTPPLAPTNVHDSAIARNQVALRNGADHSACCGAYEVGLLGAVEVYMKTLYFLRGLPASGKTTWAKKKLAALNLGGRLLLAAAAMLVTSR